jgi:hypothetical protein
MVSGTAGAGGRRAAAHRASFVAHADGPPPWPAQRRERLLGALPVALASDAHGTQAEERVRKAVRVGGECVLVWMRACLYSEGGVAGGGGGTRKKRKNNQSGSLVALVPGLLEHGH